MNVSLHLVYAQFGTSQATMLAVLDKLDIRPVEERVVGRQIRRLYDKQEIDNKTPAILKGVREMRELFRASLADKARTRQKDAVQRTPTNAKARIERKLDLLLAEVAKIKAHLEIPE